MLFWVSPSGPVFVLLRDKGTVLVPTGSCRPGHRVFLSSSEKTLGCASTRLKWVKTADFLHAKPQGFALELNTFRKNVRWPLATGQITARGPVEVQIEHC
jgi:hypothetical protein